MTDRVRVVYTGWTMDGVMFDSSLKHGGAIVLGLATVIAGWTEGIQSMVELPPIDDDLDADQTIPPGYARPKP